MEGSFQTLFLQEQCNLCQVPRPLHNPTAMDMVYDLSVPRKLQKDCVEWSQSSSLVYRFVRKKGMCMTAHDMVWGVLRDGTWSIRY